MPPVVPALCPPTELHAGTPAELPLPPEAPGVVPAALRSAFRIRFHMAAYDIFLLCLIGALNLEVGEYDQEPLPFMISASVNILFK